MPTGLTFDGAPAKDVFLPANGRVQVQLPLKSSAPLHFVPIFIAGF